MSSNKSLLASGVTKEDKRISSQPEVDFEERDITLSPWLISAAAFLIAWLALGYYSVEHPEVEKHLTRFIQMSMEQEVWFRFHMLWLSTPIQPSILATAAAVLVWIAFLRAEWSDRLLFSAAVILSSTVIVGGTEGFIYAYFHQWYGSTTVCAGVATYTVCLLLAHRARSGVFAVLSILALLYALVLPYYARYASILDIAGGVFLAGAVLCASFFIAERAGVQLFATTD